MPGFDPVSAGRTLPDRLGGAAYAVFSRGLSAGAVLLVFLACAVGLVASLAPVGQAGALAALVQRPGVVGGAVLSLASGLVSTLCALGLCFSILAGLGRGPMPGWVRRSLAPLLAVPHAATALGLAALLAPSGWIARLLSPGVTGWDMPPDLLLLKDPLAISLTLGLVVKELPFLLLVSLAALPGLQVEARMRQAQSLGKAPTLAFVTTVLPALYPQIRLPVLAVLAYGTTNVDMALILGPDLPPTLGVQLAEWLSRPHALPAGLAAAGVLALMGVTGLALVLWRGVEALGRRGAGRLIAGGWAGQGAEGRLRGLGLRLSLVPVVLPGMGLAVLALWSVSGPWPFPADLPREFSLKPWAQALPQIWPLVLRSAVLAALVSALALAMALALFERGRLSPLLLLPPLILPQLALLPGLTTLTLALGAQPGILPVALAHLFYVLPYVLLSLQEPYRRLDPRLDQAAAALGCAPWRRFLRLRLPLLRPAIATAWAIGFAVSIGQYLPTLLLGGGRVATLTTEALALGAGGNRRLVAALALMQAALPLLAFAAALALAAPPRPGRPAGAEGAAGPEGAASLERGRNERVAP